jgi:hypothetical protein
MKFLKSILACVAALALFAQAASAAVTLTLTPVTSSTVSVGDTVQYYLTISGLMSTDNVDTALSGFVITLDFDGTTVSLSLADYLSSFGGVTETDSILTDTAVTDSTLSLAAFSSTTEASAFSSQSSSFTLATITITAVSSGTTTISIDTDSSSLTDQNGNTIVIGSTSDATVTVVPEPSVTALVGLAGLLVFIKFRRRLAQAA